jgi:broad specificity phosphatase PhoE
MSVLTVVRHGQARPFQKISDCLSDLGEQQARALKEYFARTSAQFDEVICGSLNRHSQTAALATELPPAIDPAWNEYDAEAILAGYPHPSTFASNREFQKVFEHAMEQWLATEGFQQFHARVLAGLRKIQQGPSNRRVLLFTSGGPIGVLIQTALDAPPRSFAAVNWRVRNCSLSEFVFSADRLSLDSFNSVAHLDPALQTFR